MSSDTWHLQRIEVGAAVYTLTPDPRALRRGHGASASALWRQRRQHQTRTWRNRWVMRLWCVLWRVWLFTWCERCFYWALFCTALSKWNVSLSVSLSVSRCSMVKWSADESHKLPPSSNSPKKLTRSFQVHITTRSYQLKQSKYYTTLILLYYSIPLSYDTTTYYTFVMQLRFPNWWPKFACFHSLL